MKPYRNCLAIGYISAGVELTQFTRSLWRFHAADRLSENVWDADPIEATGPGTGGYLDDNRNVVANAFMERGNEALLSVDTDMEFTPTAIEMLLEVLDPDSCPIVSGFYCARRSGILTPEWFNLTPDGYVPVEEIGHFGMLQPIGACGAGFCMIHRAAFEKFPVLKDDPWRWYGRDLGMMEGRKSRLAEDITFCHRARQYGLSVFGHCGVAHQLIHHKREPITAAMLIRERTANAQ